MKNILKRVVLFIIVALVVAIIVNFNLLKYGIGQLSGQMKIIFNAVPNEYAIANKLFDDDEIQKLKLIGEIRQFSSDTLGLTTNNNYTKIYDQQNKPILWIVTACLPFDLESYEWHFPILGKVSYKGYFDKEKAILEKERIYRLGYDTRLSTVSAWSTLGFLSDPVLSNMLKRTEGKLTELIIHESTHATIYLESAVDYNENLATFIGEQGALDFLKMKYGEGSTEYISYNEQLEDEKLFGKYMIQSATKLDSLYDTFGDIMPVREKGDLKYSLIADIMTGIKYLPLNDSLKYDFDIYKGKLPNNTFFMSYTRYRSKQQDFKNDYMLNFESDLKLFITDKVDKEELEYSSGDE
jgi:predicted aminopeptidase